jgi:putative restriction endonuclease
MAHSDIYLRKFAQLNANKNRRHWTEATTFRAPHKPLLLLSVMDLFGQGRIQTNLIELNEDLLELFGIYWHIVRPPSQRGDITMPFFHLQSDGFWHLLPQPGQEATLATLRRIDSMSQLREVLQGAKLDDALFDLLQTEHGRSQLRHVLITTYFAPELQEALLKQTAVNVAAFQYSETLLEQARQQQKVIRETDIAEPVRDQGFRRAIVTAYEHRCAFCGIRMRTADGHTAVAAAHIIPWSISYDDDVHNGLALCHLCHWTFDEGLMTVNGRYQLQTSPQLSHQFNLPGHLVTLDQRPLITPSDANLWPATNNLAWHRRHRFRH